MTPQPLCCAACQNGSSCTNNATWRCYEHGWLCGRHSDFDHAGRWCKRCEETCVEYWDYVLREVRPMTPHLLPDGRSPE
jgi:hypothetical protein